MVLYMFQEQLSTRFQRNMYTFIYTQPFHVIISFLRITTMIFFHVTPSTKSGFISTPCLSGVSRKDERFVENNAVNITLHNVGAGNSVNVRGLWTFQDNQLH